MLKVKGHCHTNLDGYDCSLVKEFSRTPNIGEWVKCTRLLGGETSLKVVRVTHDIMNGEPYVILELHK